MAIRTILLLGDPRLYDVSEPVGPQDLESLGSVVTDLFDTMREFQRRHGWGRAISAPQIGVPKRLVCMQVDKPLTLVNPVIEDPSPELEEHWEDCMSFPELLVRLRNPARCRLRYRDLNWRDRMAIAEGDYAELLQHEVDHLDGILSTQRAIDDRSIALRRAMPPKETAMRGRFELLD